MNETDEAFLLSKTVPMSPPSRSPKTIELHRMKEGSNGKSIIHGEAKRDSIGKTSEERFLRSLLHKQLSFSSEAVKKQAVKALKQQDPSQPKLEISENIRTDPSNNTSNKQSEAYSNKSVTSQVILHRYEKLHQRMLVPFFFVVSYAYLSIYSTDYNWTMALICMLIMSINLPHFRDMLQSTVVEKAVSLMTLTTAKTHNTTSEDFVELPTVKQKEIITKLFTFKFVIIGNISLQFLRLILANKDPTFAWMTIGFMASTVHNLSSYILHNSIALGENGVSTALWTILPLNVLSIGTSFILAFVHGRYSESFGALTMLTIFNLVFNTTSYKLMEKLNVMNLMTGRLKEANKSKNALVSSISHEFRSPLMSISGCIELLLDTKLTEDQIQYLKTIGCCSSILLTLIEDILQYSKLEKGNVEIASTTDTEEPNYPQSAFSLGECLDHIKGITTTYGQNFDVSVDLIVSNNLPMYVLGESVRLQQVLINLITNAIKASPGGKTVTLMVEVPDEDDPKDHPQESIVDSTGNRVKTVVFKVIDQGKGIPKDSSKYAF